MGEFETKVFVDYLIEMLEISRKLEALKMEVTRMEDFNLRDAYFIFDP
jgi:hypothetical protein